MSPEASVAGAPALEVTISAQQLAAHLGLPQPSAEQAAVIESPLAPGVVIAGAGSGKTETMATRVVWLVANDFVTPESVLGLTFTRKAAAELSRRIRRRIAQWRRHVEYERPDDHAALARLQAGEPTVATYAAYAGRLVEEHALLLGAEPMTRLLSPAARWQLADSTVRRYPEELPDSVGVLASVVSRVLALSDQLADHGIGAEELERFIDQTLARIEALPPGLRTRSDYPKDTAAMVTTLQVRGAMVPLLHNFAQLKASRRSGDFADQMTLAARLATLAQVVQAERTRFPVVLLDEYQDSGQAQIAMLRGLFGAGHPVTAVGDPFQSIYAWRGASAGSIARFDAQFAGPDGPARVFPLATSWRNAERILTVANAVAAPLRQEEAGVIELRARPGAPEGEAHAAVLHTVKDQARWVAAQLAQRWNSQPEGDRTAAVLVRRRAQIPLLHEAILDAGLPVEVVGLGGLLTTAEVSDVRTLLQVLADHRAGPALMRVLCGARWRIGPRDIAMLGKRARVLAGSRQLPAPDPALASDAPAASADLKVNDPVSLIEALDDLGAAQSYSAQGYERMLALSHELRRLRRRLSAPLVDLIAEVEAVTGVDIEVAARADRAAVGRAHLDRFLDEAARFAADSDEISLPGFLAFLDVAEKEENGLEQAEAIVGRERVQILTVHGAKGLEWDTVAIPGLVGEVFPAKGTGIDWAKAKDLLPTPLRGDREDLPALDWEGVESRRELADRISEHAEKVRERQEREERRLAYVAYTRAKEVLLLSAYVWDNTIDPRAVSPFLTDVRAHVEIDQWCEPEPEETNPLTSEMPSARWPTDPLGARREALEQGAQLVREAMVRAETAQVPSGSAASVKAAPGGLVLPGLLGDRIEDGERWRRDVDLLLAEKARLEERTEVAVVLPNELTVSELVLLQRDPAALARALRRPMPRRPAQAARRGTRFHRWVEQRWEAQPLLDIDELPGAADNLAVDEDLQQLQGMFNAGQWGARKPFDIEVGFEMAIGPVVVRGRMDAVFGPDSAGPDLPVPAVQGHARAPEWIVVDWKTGHRPRGKEADAAAVQLAAYRLAWAHLMGMPDDELHRVGAAFYYVRSDETVNPVDLLDADGLRRLIETAGG